MAPQACTDGPRLRTPQRSSCETIPLTTEGSQGDALFGTITRAGLIACVVGVAFATAPMLLIVVRAGQDIVWDQSFISYRFSGGYPHFEEGIVSHLLVGLINTVGPLDPVGSNTLIRAFAALFYMGSAGLLAWAVTGPERLWGFVAFLALLGTSRFPFLWLSSELFAGAFLMLFLWSLARGHRIEVTGLFLVLFGLTKADVALPALLVGAYLAIRPGEEVRWRRAAVLGGFVLVLVAPSLSATSYYEQFGGRAWVSFGQHYGELVRPHQLEPAPDGWSGWPRYLEAAFPGATSVPGAASSHPRTYIGFVALSVVESTIRLLFSHLLLLIPVAAFFYIRMRPAWRVIVLLLCSGVVPIVLVSFMHVRYQARFYPLVLFVVFAGLLDGRLGRRSERILAAALALLVLWQAMQLPPMLEAAHWVPD